MDKAREQTDKKLAQMEKEISRQYRQAQSEITEKWNAYMERAGKRLEKHEAALSNAMRSGDKEEIAKAKKRLEDAKKAITIQDNRYKAMVEDTALRIAKANEIAVAYINNQTPEIYANNYNQVNGLAEDNDIQFRMINEDVVRQRISKGDIQITGGFDPNKDINWNTKKMNSAVLQGILQGEAMDKIAERLLPIVDGNERSAMREARTLVNQAENSGRWESYKALEKQGAVLKKVWKAIGDERTRTSHLELDGTAIDIGDVFMDSDGNALRFPADPWADPATVYNCRCGMVTEIIGVRGKDGKVHKNQYAFDEHDDLHQEEIDKEKARRKRKQKERQERQKQLQEKAKKAENVGKYDYFNGTKFVDTLFAEGGNAEKVARRLKDTKAKYNPVMKLKKELTKEQIIDRLGGGDETKGSCASLSLAYAGNRHGLDVLDFRGGASQKLFSSNWWVFADHFGAETIEGYNDLTTCHKLFKKVEEGKEYILQTGRHAAVIRKGKDGMEYLELQAYSGNGFKPLDDTVLKRRFACKQQHTYGGGHKYEVPSTLLDVEKMKDDETLRGILGFMNTDPSEQKKGKLGYAK